jgi:hypothetical protein
VAGVPRRIRVTVRDMTGTEHGDLGGSAARTTPRAGGLILGAVVLGLVAVLSVPAVVDWDTLGQTAVFLVSAAAAVLLGTRAARVRRGS